jgi:enamine deaminase RidA (YjgF/YER057c/UK114 family)
MSNIVRIETNSRASRAVVHNGIVYLCGMTAEDRSQDIRGQTVQALARIEKYLALAGTDKSQLLTAQIWIKDIVNDFQIMNEVWDAWTETGCAPTRATGQCDMGKPEILVEIIVSAALP